MPTELVLLPRVAYRGREITSPRLRELLGLLAGDLRTGCSTSRLVDRLWPDEQPENPTKALQILVSRARTRLGSDIIERTPTGYRLTLEEDRVDVSAVLLRAAASARHSRAGDHAAALEQAEAGLALWDGATGRDQLDGPLSALRAERASTYRSLVRARALALSRLGRHDEAIDALAEVSAERPRDEEVLLELMRSEAATAGPAAALARYEAYRRTLRDELGADPGTALQAEHQRLLQGEAPRVRHGVRHDPNPLLGRDVDVAAVAGRLRTSRVTSIVGPGGLGKTRLAHAVSRRAEQRIVHFVALAGITRDDDVAGEVASVLGVGAEHPSVGRSTDVLTGIAGALGPGPALLVLDNCEHVVRGAADLVRALVSLTRDLHVLTTSRAPLGLSSESVYPLPELDLETSIELFNQRARAARPGVDLPGDAVAGLCRQLDGLPLAIELAAARVRVMSVTEIASRLTDRFTLLSGGPRDAPERHRTLHKVVQWSWNLLEPAGRAAMRALSIFPDGFTADAAGWLLDGGETLDVLEDLVDQSLLKVADAPAGTRFRMLETVREFATAEREAAGETDRVADRFLAWARDLGMAHHEAPFGAEPAPSLDLIRTEQDNLVQALRVAIARGDGPTAMATTAALAATWLVDSTYARMSMLVAETGWLLSHYRPEPEFVEVTRASAALLTAYTFSIHGARAVRSLVALRRLPTAPPDTVARAAAAVLRAVTEDDPAVLVQMCDSDEPLVAAFASAVVSYLRESTGDADGALKAAERILEVLGSSESPWLRMISHARLSELYMHTGQGVEALRHVRAAWRDRDALGDWPDVLGLQWAMVLSNLQVGDIDEAEHWLRQMAGGPAEETFAHRTSEIAVRAELLLARGEVDAGLAMWRRVLELMPGEWIPDARVEPGLEPWSLEIKAVAVVAHARHGRLDLVEETAAELPHALWTLLTEPAKYQPAYLAGAPVCGSLLLALGMVDLNRGAIRSGVRRIALAERFRYLRQFQLTMSLADARHAAEQADRSAYAEAVSSYADLDGEELRAAALGLLAGVSAPGPG